MEYHHRVYTAVNGCLDIKQKKEDIIRSNSPDKYSQYYSLPCSTLSQRELKIISIIYSNVPEEYKLRIARNNWIDWHKNTHIYYIPHILKKIYNSDIAKLIYGYLPFRTLRSYNYSRPTTVLDLYINRPRSNSINVYDCVCCGDTIYITIQKDYGYVTTSVKPSKYDFKVTVLCGN